MIWALFVLKALIEHHNRMPDERRWGLVGRVRWAKRDDAFRTVKDPIESAY